MTDQLFVPGGGYGGQQPPPPPPPPPYFAPPGYGQPAGEDPRNIVSLPAVFLMVAAGLGILGALGAIVLFSLAAAGVLPMDGKYSKEQVLGASLFYVILGCVQTVNCAVILFAGWRMKNLQSYTLAIVGSILAMIPLIGPCCCITGLPFGVWALIVLLKPEVKGAFQQ